MHHLLSCFVLAKPNQFFKKKFKTINATLRSTDSFRFLLKRIGWDLVKQSSSANDACNWSYANDSIVYNEITFGDPAFSINSCGCIIFSFSNFDYSKIYTRIVNNSFNNTTKDLSFYKSISQYVINCCRTCFCNSCCSLNNKWKNCTLKAHIKTICC